MKLLQFFCTSTAPAKHVVLSLLQRERKAANQEAPEMDIHIIDGMQNGLIRNLTICNRRAHTLIKIKRDKIIKH